MTIPKRLSPRLLRYLLVGGSAYCFEMGCLVLLREVLHLGPLAAVAISFWLSFVVTFIAQKIVTFRSPIARSGLHAQALGYGALVLWNYSFSLISTHLFAPIFGVFIVRTFVILITTGWNYQVYKYLFTNNDTFFKT